MASSLSSLLWALSIYNRIVAMSPAGQPVLRRHRRAAQAASRPDPEPDRDREGLCPAREIGTLDAVIQARNSAMTAQGPAQVAAAENQLSGALRQLFALSEAYPDLKANTNFLQLQSELSDIENKIAAARRFFNNAVQEYNTGIQQMPGGAVRLDLRIPPEGILRSRRNPPAARTGASGQVLTLVQPGDVACRSSASRCRVFFATPAHETLGQSGNHGGLRPLHPHRIEPAQVGVPARRAVSAGLCDGVRRRADRRRCFSTATPRSTIICAPRGATWSQSIPFATIAALIWIFIAYYFHQKMIDAVTGGHDVTRQEEPRLYNLLENLCISRGIPMPKLKVMDNAARSTPSPPASTRSNIPSP